MEGNQHFKLKKLTTRLGLAALLATSLALSASLSAQNEATKPDGPAYSPLQALVGPSGLNIFLDGAEKSSGLMKITIVGPEGERLVEEIVPAGGYHWSAFQKDGVYRYDGYLLTPDDGYTDDDHSASAKSRLIRVHGKVEVRNGSVVIPEPRERGQEISHTTPNLFEQFVGRALQLIVPEASAGNLTADGSSAPRVQWASSGSVATCCDWWITGTGFDTFGYWALSDLINTNSHDVIIVNGVDGSSDSENALVVESNGDISVSDGAFYFDKSVQSFGVGTTTPDNRGMTIRNAIPTMALEDTTDGESVSWTYNSDELDLKGNGNQNIFTINEAAPDNTMFVDISGNVGLGGVPSAALHVQRSDGSAGLLIMETNATVAARELFKLSNNGGPFFIFENKDISQSFSFAMGATGHFLLSHQQTSGVQMRLTPSGDMTISGSLSEGSSRAIKDGITPLDGSTVLAKLENLPVSEWSYTADGAKRHVGPMAEDFYAAFGLGPDNTHISPRDLAGVALAAAKALKTDNESLRSENLELRDRLEQVETRLGIN